MSVGVNNRRGSELGENSRAKKLGLNPGWDIYLL